MLDSQIIIIFTERNVHMDIYRTAFLNHLKGIQTKKEPEGLYAPIEYIMSSGGKRMRPILVLISCELFSDDYTEAFEAALSVEMFHNFTLIHDDIMDRAEMRRGKLSVHKKWNLNTGILSGDALMIQSNQRLEYYDAPVFKPLISLFNKTAIEVCEGQQMDVDFESMTWVDLNDYIQMISYKTAVLVGTALKMGAIIGKASVEDQDNIYKFGLNMGIAFQLQDDYLDTFGSSDFGKKIGGDILEGKKTFLYIKALELADEDDKIHLLSLYGSSDEEGKVFEVTAIFLKYNIDQLLLAEIEKYTSLALKDIEALSIDQPKKSVLRTFALNLMKRKT